VDTPTLHAFLRKLEHDGVLRLDLRAITSVESLLAQVAADSAEGCRWSVDEQRAAIASILARDESEWQAVDARLAAFLATPRAFVAGDAPLSEPAPPPVPAPCAEAPVLVAATSVRGRGLRLRAWLRVRWSALRGRLFRLPRSVWAWLVALSSVSATLGLIVGALWLARWLTAELDPRPSPSLSATDTDGAASSSTTAASASSTSSGESTDASTGSSAPHEPSEGTAEPSSGEQRPFAHDERTPSSSEQSADTSSSGPPIDQTPEIDATLATPPLNDDPGPPPAEQRPPELDPPTTPSSEASAVSSDFTQPIDPQPEADGSLAAPPPLVEVLRLRPEPNPATRAVTGIILWLVSLLLSTLAIRWLGARRRHVLAREEEDRQAMNLRRQQAEDDDAQLLTYAVERFPPLPAAVIDDGAAILGRLIELGRGSELDVAATLDATVREAGRFAPIVHPSRRQHHLTVLVDVETGCHPFLHAFLSVLTRWHQLGVRIERFDFKHRPRFVQPCAVDGDSESLRMDAAPRLTLDELARRGEGSPLLIATRMAELAEKRGAMPWLRHVGAWPVRVVLDLDPRPLAERDGETHRVVALLRRSGIVRFPYTPEGLRALAMHLTYGAGTAVPEPALRPWREVLPALQRWAALAACVPDPTWLQLEAFRRHFDDLRQALPDQRYVQRLLDWLRSQKENPISADGGRLAISGALVTRLLEDLRHAEGLVPGQISTVERHARELIIRQIEAATPTSGVMSERRAMRLAFHRAILEPARADALLPFFGCGVAPELKSMLAAHIGRVPHPSGSTWRSLSERLAPATRGPIPLRHLLARPWWQPEDVPLLVIVAGASAGAWLALAAPIQSRSPLATMIGASGFALLPVVFRRRRPAEPPQVTTAPESRKIVYSPRDIMEFTLLVASIWCLFGAVSLPFAASRFSDYDYLMLERSETRQVLLGNAVALVLSIWAAGRSTFGADLALIASVGVLVAAVAIGPTHLGYHGLEMSWGGYCAIASAALAASLSLLKLNITIVPADVPATQPLEPRRGGVVDCSRVALHNVAPMRFIRLGGGEFAMGSNDKGSLPRRPVIVSDFSIGVTPVTRAQWFAVMGGKPPHEDANFPRTQVSWLDAIRFLNRLSLREGLVPCYDIEGEMVRWHPQRDGYRLLTEGEWEYAARAGTTTIYSFGDNPKDGLDYAWFSGNCDGLQPVGLKRPNPWGLYDVHGNVWEWVWDRYGNYPAEFSIDPLGPDNCGPIDIRQMRVLRGGSCADDAARLRSAARIGENPMLRVDYIGFRVARGRLIMD
jgi:sulfatase modifying factor 1